MTGGGVVLCCWRNSAERAPCRWRATNPQEALLRRARAEQKSPEWQARYKSTRPIVERKVSHFTRRPWGGRKARVRGATHHHRRPHPSCRPQLGTVGQPRLDLWRPWLDIELRNPAPRPTRRAEGPGRGTMGTFSNRRGGFPPVVCQTQPQLQPNTDVELQGPYFSAVLGRQRRPRADEAGWVSRG